MQVQVHLIESFLDVLNPHRCAFDQALAMALQAAQPANGVLGTKRRG
jgi:GTP cyclohydrolase II